MGELAGDPCPFCGSEKCQGITPSSTKKGYFLTYYFLNKSEHEMNKCSPHEMKCNECNQIFWIALHKDKIEDDIRYKSFKNTDEFQLEKDEFKQSNSELISLLLMNRHKEGDEFKNGKKERIDSF